VQDEVLPFFSDSVLDRFADSTETDYLEKRGVSALTQGIFGCKYDKNHYRKLKNGEEYIGEAILIPHRFQGALVGYQVGWIGADRPKEIPKYTNSQSFPKAQTVFNYDRAVESDGLVYVVESVITVMYLHSLGYDAIATFGASIQDDQIDLMLDFGDSLVLCYDNDAPGRSATDKIIKRLGTSAALRFMHYPSFLPEKIDLNDLEPDEVETMLTLCVSPAIFWEGGV
jgi:DNA primase